MSRIAEHFSPELYGGLPGFKERTTSRDAALSVAPGSAEGRERVYVAIRDAGHNGLTADEAAAVVGFDVLYARPRVAELAKANRIFDSGGRRRNVSSKSAKVWRVSRGP